MENYSEILPLFNRGQLLFVTFNPDTHEITSYGERSSDWEDFVSSLPLNECRYFVVNVDHTSTTDGVTRTKSGFGLWCPSSAAGKQKMTTAFFCAEFLSKIEPFIGGIKATRIEAGTHEALEKEAVVEKVFRYSRVK